MELTANPTVGTFNILDCYTLRFTHHEWSFLLTMVSPDLLLKGHRIDTNMDTKR